MDIEFHYWLTAIIADHAGFNNDETRIIAYSSQYVDDNDVSMIIVDRKTNQEYKNYISQTMDITKPKRELMRIYPIFHFLPGQADALSARRRDGKMHILTTTPDNQNANRFMDTAFKSADEYRYHRIGIATHAYVDSWAHQNYVGWYDDFNGMGKILPNIGHADAAHHPDMVGYRWEDSRLVDTEVNNNLRFLQASESLFNKYRDHLDAVGRYQGKQKPEWEALESKIIEIIQPASSQGGHKRQKQRIASYRKAVEWLVDYDELDWFDDAVETKIRGVRDSQNGLVAKLPVFFKDEYFWREDNYKEATDWFVFQQAVRDHQSLGMEIITPIYRQMGVDIQRA